MRTLLGTVGAFVIFTAVGITVLVLNRTQSQTGDLRFIDDGIRTENELRPAYTLRRPEGVGLNAENVIGEGWQKNIRKDETVAKKTPAGTAPVPKVTEPKEDATRQKQIEYVGVGELWKVPPPTTHENPPQKNNAEDAVHATIRAFGNAVGTHIQAFVLTHSNQHEKLGSFTSKRDQQGREYVASLARDYDKLATKVRGEKAPAVFAELHTNFAAGYNAIADGLRVLEQATNDADTYTHMLTYNTEVETFGSAFVPFALMFKEQGVVFKDYEPGGIFTPPVSE